MIDDGLRYERTDGEKEAHATQQTRILAMLRNAPGGVSASELKMVTHRFSAPIKDLRTQGHVIERFKSDDGENCWRYIRRIEVVEVTEEWKARYYESPHWKRMRYLRRQHDDHRCCHCRATSSLEVHHWCYDLFEEDLMDLVTLCSTCHERIHSRVQISFPATVLPEVDERLRTGYVANNTPAEPTQRGLF